MRFVHGPGRTPADVDDEIVTRVRAMAEHTLAAHVPAGGPVLPTQVTDTWERAASIVVPVLVIPGLADSPDHVRFAEQLAEVVPDGRVAPIADTAHYPNMERPTAFDAALRSFLTSGRDRRRRSPNRSRPGGPPRSSSAASSSSGRSTRPRPAG